MIGNIISFRFWFNTGCASFSLAKKNDLVLFAKNFRITEFLKYLDKISDDAISLSKKFNNADFERYSILLNDPFYIVCDNNNNVQFSNLADLIWCFINIDVILGSKGWVSDFIRDGFYNNKVLSPFTQLGVLYVLLNLDLKEFLNLNNDAYSFCLNKCIEISIDPLFIQLSNSLTDIYNFSQFDLFSWRDDLYLSIS